MVARFSTCDKRRLREVLVGRAAENVEDELAEHLERCATCRRDLELLAGGADWFSDVRSFLSSVNEPLLTDRSARSAPTRQFDDGSLPDGHDLATWRKQLAFLSPTETPESLGRLGSYEITGVIGRGGMGIVLKA